MLNRQETAQRLEEALAKYQGVVSPNYDEIFADVEQRFAINGSLSKLDIGGLLLWKRLQANTTWARELNARPNSEVQLVTHEAREAYLENWEPDLVSAARAARRLLATLPGFVNGDALASAVISAIDPKRMPIYDRRADAGLRAVLGRELKQGPGRYGRYVEQVHELIQLLADESGVDRTAREVDLALYTLGGG